MPLCFLLPPQPLPRPVPLPHRSQCNPTLSLSRRSLLHILPPALLSVLPLPSLSSPDPYKRLPLTPYDVFGSRRYIPQGRPPPDRTPPKFSTSPFPLDPTLQAEDVRAGAGQVIDATCLVAARWVMVLDDGTTVDDENEKRVALFRPGAHQVPPGVEDAVVGMKEGGWRRVRGSAERVLTSVREGYDIGERSLVPNGATVFIDVFVDQVNPYGK